jgi:hypothetical protein
VDVIVSAGGPKPTIFICYASVTGNTQSYINSVAQVLSGCCSLQVVAQDLRGTAGQRPWQQQHSLSWLRAPTARHCCQVHLLAAERQRRGTGHI